MSVNYTDEQIKKALECCIKSTHFGECFENKCPMVSEDGCAVGKETLYPHVLDLINRQEAEIDELNNEFVKTFSDLPNRVRDAKTSGVASFAKFLIDKSKDGVIHINDLPDYVVEMVGEGE